MEIKISENQNENKMFKAIIQLAKEIGGNSDILFETPVRVRKTPHTPDVNLYGITVSKKGRVAVMDNEGEWAEVTEEETLVVNSLHQRLRYMANQSETITYKTAI